MPQVGERGKINKLKGNYRVLPDLNHPSVVDALASFIQYLDEAKEPPQNINLT